MKVVNQALTIPSSDPITRAVVAFYRIGDSAIYIQGQMHPSDSPKSFTLSVLQPAERFACALNYFLEQEGISSESVQVGDCNQQITTSWSEISVMQSDELVNVMNYTLQESDNLFTECFLRTLGSLFQGLGGSNAQDEGLNAVKEILQSYQVNVGTFVQDDGSGLSRHNIVSPQALVEVLVMMSYQPTGATYRTLLPVAGESGTLSNRFVGTPAQGIVQAKTGSMTGVNTLSGYIDASSNFPQIVFSILTNFSDKSSSTVRPGIDDIVLLLTQLEGPLF